MLVTVPFIDSWFAKWGLLFGKVSGIISGTVAQWTVKSDSVDDEIILQKVRAVYHLLTNFF